MGKNVTIYDVAREAGVSLATVSRVINGSNVVKPNTRERVMEAIQRLDFKPNQIARGLATSKTTTIAIVFPQSLFAHVKDMIGGIGDTSRRLDYNVSIYTTDEIGDGNPIETVIEKVVKSRADGVILFNNEEIEQEIQLVNKYKIPSVVIGSRVSSEYMGSIFIDAKKIAYDIVDEYLSKGKKDIVFVSPKQNLIRTEDLILGIEEAYQKHGMTFDKDKQILPTSTHYEKSYPQFLEYFKNHKHDLVFSGYDKEAVAVVNAAIDNGIQVPGDMEVIGMMDTSYALICRPALTSIHVPVYDMGALAVRLLTKILNEEEIDAREVPVQHLLMPRGTTK
ncbi:MAG: LacI family DNA-binding transcriptional regulator [Longibaculum muris]|uniref:LacI family transcriptional regulator n=1 Tax=Longibaculum muris TaxID=1796628 RepID=A0A4R3YK99_9FIRM|nr:LacI family DNA-binding transcriptional regulator [Longibaculum muris]KXU52002.1 putative catabolite control protein A [Candidatus Stoquefichus sp. KLE1796]MBS5369486.1 LacI family DNA-binding transcriptional regulator [Coprobacillus cateniformis]MCR1889178.1 LacI family transcriptional regulator [Longibaculum muris]MED9810772.1 LacI family DNA-binding transcriptional regulator [Longibaculum muris]TCV92542.1 LacI family transcriptional regulator [Longibaculum muris]